MGVIYKKLWLDPRCTALPLDRYGPFVNLRGGDLMTFDDNATAVSEDDGRTWSAPRKMHRGRGPGVPCKGGVAVRTRKGVLVYVYMDMGTFKFTWNKKRAEAGPDCRLDVWSIRSLDGGRTWCDRTCLMRGYCGALLSILETSSGEIVVPLECLIANPSRHATQVYVSADAGQSWRPSNLIDLGGHGHHDGGTEPVAVELKDGRLWMLIRTNLDRFWEAFSSDKGYSWRVIQPTNIDASSSPAAIARLASGRLALAWNRLYPEGKRRYPRRGGDCQLSATKASWQREELSLTFSDDDGKSWSKPTVIARLKNAWLSYPLILERRPGELWVTTLYRETIAISVCERDFV